MAKYYNLSGWRYSVRDWKYTLDRINGEPKEEPEMTKEKYNSLIAREYMKAMEEVASQAVNRGFVLDKQSYLFANLIEKVPMKINNLDLTHRWNFCFKGINGGSSYEPEGFNVTADCVDCRKSGSPNTIFNRVKDADLIKLLNMVTWPELFSTCEVKRVDPTVHVWKIVCWERMVPRDRYTGRYEELVVDLERTCIGCGYKQNQYTTPQTIRADTRYLNSSLEIMLMGDGYWPSIETSCTTSDTIPEWAKLKIEQDSSSNSTASGAALTQEMMENAVKLVQSGMTKDAKDLINSYRFGPAFPVEIETDPDLENGQVTFISSRQSDLIKKAEESRRLRIEEKAERDRISEIYRNTEGYPEFQTLYMPSPYSPYLYGESITVPYQSDRGEDGGSKTSEVKIEVPEKKTENKVNKDILSSERKIRF